MTKQEQISFMRLLDPFNDSDYAATWEEIGEELGMSRQGAEQLGMCALYKFRRNFIRQGLGKYYDAEI